MTNSAPPSYFTGLLISVAVYLTGKRERNASQPYCTSKDVKQVSELEAIIAKLVLDKEQLETKLECYEMKERKNATRYNEKNSLVSEDNRSSTSTKKLSKKKSKKSRKDIEIIGATHTDELVQEQLKCVNPTSRDEEEEEGNPAFKRKNDSNPLEESDVLGFEISNHIVIFKVI